VSNTKSPAISITSPGVNIAVVKKDDDGWKFLLVQRAETESYPGCWGFVTGTKEGNETAAQIVARELKEEVGLTAERLWSTEYLIQFYEPEFDQIWILPLIVAVVSRDSAVTLTAENSGFAWLYAHKARKLVSWKNLVKAIEDITDELEVYPAKTWVEILR
jgi:8-oxo-dGTP pyrophosphatase MutT (NUDIX family)